MDRTQGIGGSDARRVWTGDWHSLWLEKTGQTEPKDLSSIIPVNIGVITEQYNIELAEKELDIKIDRSINLEQYKHMTSNVDGLSYDKNKNATVIECKHTHQDNDMMYVAQYYYAQLHHYMSHLKFLNMGTNHCYLSVIFGNNKHETGLIDFDPEFADELLKRESAFWKYVETRKEPSGFDGLIDISPKVIPIDGMTPRDMSDNADFVSTANTYLETKSIVDIHNNAKAKLKSLVPGDCNHAYTDTISIKRNKNNQLRILGVNND